MSHPGKTEDPHDLPRPTSARLHHSPALPVDYIMFLTVHTALSGHSFHG